MLGCSLLGSCPCKVSAFNMPPLAPTMLPGNPRCSDVDTLLAKIEKIANMLPFKGHQIYAVFMAETVELKVEPQVRKALFLIIAWRSLPHPVVAICLYAVGASLPQERRVPLQALNRGHRTTAVTTLL